MTLNKLNTLNKIGMGDKSSASWSSYWATRTPSNLVATVISFNQINVVWDDATQPADGLKVYVATSQNGAYVLKNTVAYGVEAASITGLLHNTRYWIKLVAYKGVNESDPIYDDEITLKGWWLAGGVAAANCIGAYNALGSVDLAASKVNLANPGTYDLGGGVDPTHDPALGWVFNGTTQYFKTGIVPENDQTWSMIIKFSEYTTGDDCIAGLYEGANQQFLLSDYSSTNARNFGNGGVKNLANSAASGVICVAGSKRYFDGVNQLGAAIPAPSGSITYDIWIGALHYTTPIQFFDGNIQSIAIYDKVLSDAEVLAITNEMNLSPDLLNRMNYVNQGFGALVCFDQASFRTSAFEVGETNGNVNTFAPTGLDVDNWLDACVSAGMKYAILTTKHHAGFKLWNSASKVGENVVYGAQSTTWYAANGNPDITKLFVDGCRSRGLKVGLYYSIWDLTWEAQTGEDQTTDAAGYIAMIEAELTELLTNYGDIDSLWFDGWQWHIGYAAIPYATIYNFVKGLQANCVVVENAHTYPSITSEIDTYEKPIDGSIAADNTRLAEEIDTIRNDGKWFYHSDLGQTASEHYTKSQINTLKAQINGRYGTYLLGITPDTAGNLPSAQKALLESLTT